MCCRNLVSESQVSQTITPGVSWLLGWKEGVTEHVLYSYIASRALLETRALLTFWCSHLQDPSDFPLGRFSQTVSMAVEDQNWLLLLITNEPLYNLVWRYPGLSVMPYVAVGIYPICPVLCYRPEYQSQTGNSYLPLTNHTFCITCSSLSPNPCVCVCACSPTCALECASVNIVTPRIQQPYSFVVVLTQDLNLSYSQGPRASWLIRPRDPSIFPYIHS